MSELIQIQILRSETPHKRPLSSTLLPGQPAVNLSPEDPGLYFLDSSYSDIFKIGPCHVGDTAPNSTPAVGGSTGNSKGETWLDTTDPSAPVLKVWDGAAWQSSQPGVSNTLWVSTQGDDGNSGLSPGAAKKTIKAALDIATPGVVISVSPGTYEEENPLVISVDNIAVIGQGPKVTEIIPQNDEDVFHVDNASLIQGFSFTGSPLTSKAIVAFPSTGAGTITIPPRVKDCVNYITGSVSVHSDGDLALDNPKINVDNFVSQTINGVGFKASNKGYLEINNCETVYANDSVLAETGGNIRATNCKSMYGDRALVSNGTSVLEEEGEFQSIDPSNRVIEIDNMVNFVRPYEGQVLTVGETYYKVCAFNVTNQGNGFTSIPQVNVSVGTGPNAQAAQGIAIIEGGKLVRVDVSVPGGGYQDTDIVTVSVVGGSPSSPASVQAVTCPIYYIVDSSTAIVGGGCTVEISEPLGYTPSPGDEVKFYRVSKIVALSHYMGHVGSGNITPAEGGTSVPSNQIVKEEGGQIYSSSMDQSGHFKIGEDITIDQTSGRISGPAFTNSVLSLVLPYILTLS